MLAYIKNNLNNTATIPQLAEFCPSIFSAHRGLTGW